MITDNIQLGKKFEDEIHQLIIQTNYPVFRENEIIKKYDKSVYGIDHLIQTSFFIVTIQDKWRQVKPTLNEINHFLMATRRISKIENKSYLAIYLSKLPPTSNAKLAISFDNSNSYNEIITINGDSHELLKIKLSILLYKYKIYFYDYDDSAIMLDYIHYLYK